jgi:hypothetical protein
MEPSDRLRRYEFIHLYSYASSVSNNGTAHDGLSRRRLGVAENRAAPPLVQAPNVPSSSVRFLSSTAHQLPLAMPGDVKEIR